MPNPKYAYTIGDDGFSIDDIVFFIGGTLDPWGAEETERYPEGTRYYKTDGKVFIKKPTGTNPAQKDYEVVDSGNGGGPININCVGTVNVENRGGQVKSYPVEINCSEQ